MALECHQTSSEDPVEVSLRSALRNDQPECALHVLNCERDVLVRYKLVQATVHGTEIRSLNFEVWHNACIDDREKFLWTV